MASSSSSASPSPSPRGYTYAAPKGFRELLAEPKGKTTYFPSESFLLHVFWEVPSPAAADRLIAGLAQCAAATRRDTPCVPTYFFRVYEGDFELCTKPPTCVGDHPAIASALRKIACGVPLPAIRGELTRKGVDPALLDLPANSPLPLSLIATPQCVELTEVYLDERSFVEHAGSRDFLDGHALVMDPALIGGRLPLTLRLGTPNAGVVEKILDPCLRAQATDMQEGCCVWRSGSAVNELALFVSLDTALSAESAAAALSEAFKMACSTLVVFKHPLREGTTRVMAVLTSIPSTEAFAGVTSALHPLRGEVHVTAASGAEDAELTDRVVGALNQAGLGFVSVNRSQRSGYILHDLAHSTREEA